jgi:hypothetical protein
MPRQQEPIDARAEVPWFPVFPGAVFTLILLHLIFPIGSLLTLVGLGFLAARLVQRRWDPWAWAGLGVAIGACVFWALVLLHQVF